jgi:hypothetical protein
MGTQFQHQGVERLIMCFKTTQPTTQPFWMSYRLALTSYLFSNHYTLTGCHVCIKWDTWYCAGPSINPSGNNGVKRALNSLRATAIILQ